MARRKKKHQEAPGALSDSSDDNQKGIAGCTHVSRAVDLGNLKKVLRNGLPNHCQACANGPKTTSELPKTSTGTASQASLPSDPCLSTPVALSSEHRPTSTPDSLSVDTAALPVSSEHPEACLPVPSVNGSSPVNCEGSVEINGIVGEDGDPGLCHKALDLRSKASETHEDPQCANGSLAALDQVDVTTESFAQQTEKQEADKSVIGEDSSLNADATHAHGDPSGDITVNGIASVPFCKVTPDVQDSTALPDDTSNAVGCDEDPLLHTNGLVSSDAVAEAAERIPEDGVPSDAASQKDSSVTEAAPVDIAAPQENGCPLSNVGALDGTSDAAAVNGNPSDVAREAVAIVQNVTEALRLVCLRCGHLGCGSQGPHHALQHFLTPHSDPHCLALALDAWQLWCYECNRAVEINRRLAQAVQFVQKRLSENSARNNVSTNRTAKSSSIREVPSVQQSTICESAVTSEKATVSATRSASRAKSKDVQKGTKREDSEDDGRRIKGLANLGNTCFFNSVMQNLGQTPYLEDLLRARCKAGLRCTFKPAETAADLGPLEADLPQARPLTQALLEFLQEMRCGMPRPRPVHTQVCQVAPQFRGNQQHDSHELLRHLVEGVCNEEAKRQKQAVLASFGLSTKVKPSEVDENIKNKIQAYKESVSQTVLDEVFGGVLLTTIVCQECGHVIRREEPFKDLSLPIPDDKPMRLVKKVPEEANSKKCARQQRKERRDKRGRKTSETQEEKEEVACESCTLSGGGSMEMAADDEADDEDTSPAAEPVVKVTPVVTTKTLAPRPPQPQDGTLLACLHQFTSPELLIGANALSCDGCGNGKRAAASLQLLVQDPPRILTLHLKRFQQSGRALSKVNRHVPFPLNLDLAPYCSPQQNLEEGSSIEYALYGVVEHSGRLSGGHYTAYVKVRSNGRWFHASDSHVTEVTEAVVLKSQAYLLFYERLR